MKVPIAAGLIVVLTFSGCSFEAKVNEKNETELGSHHVTVKPGSAFISRSSFSGGGTEIHQFTCGDVSVEIRNNELIVNSVRYGELAPGVAVTVDHGAVFVGGEKREGKP